MKELTMTAARVRKIRGENQYNNISRFILEIPPNLVGRGTPSNNAPAVRPSQKDMAHTRAKEAFKTKTFDPQQFKVVKADSLEYKVGDKVSHVKFGEGTVLEIADGGRDYEVKVEFDRVGVKRMFASFAKLKKVESL